MSSFLNMFIVLWFSKGMTLFLGVCIQKYLKLDDY